MSEDEKVYEIDLSKKYVLCFDKRLSHEEYHWLRERLDEWRRSDNPFFVISGGVKLVKVDLPEPDIATAVNSISSSGLRAVTSNDMLEVIHQGNVDSPTPQSDESTN